MTWKNNLRAVEPYIAGEQPSFDQMIKLNTNENPYPPTPKLKEILDKFDFDRLRLYPNADADTLRLKLAQYYGLKDNQIFIGNGSDEVLSLAFLTFFNSKKPLLMPDVSYSFYSVYCKLYGINFQKVPLDHAFRLKTNDYFQENGGVVFPNPNAPTGLLTDLSQIENILRHNSNSIVVVDEAYIDFGGQTAIPLLEKYENLVITQTFSKSRSLAGLRLGIALGNPVSISRLYDVKNSFNSYPVDQLAQTLSLTSLSDQAYFDETVKKIITTRENFKHNLSLLGFEQTNSQANFVFVKHPKKSGEELFKALYDEKIIVRHWNLPRINDYLRITIGTDKQMTQVSHFLKNYLES